MENCKKTLYFLTGLIILTGFYFLSCAVVKILHINFPPAILGLIMFSFSLISGLVKEKYVESACNFLLKNMAMFLVPFMAGLIVYKTLLIKNWFVILIVIFSATTLTIVLTGLFVEYGIKIMRLERMKHHND